MIDHNQLLLQWEEDCKLDRSDVLHILYSHPMLHSKYLTHLQTYKVQLRKMTLKFFKLKGLKTRYYNGECTQEELQKHSWPQYQYKRPLKAEMESLLNADEDLQLLQEQSLYTETLVQSCESILREITSRGYLLKSIVEYQKFLSGAG